MFTNSIYSLNNVLRIGYQTVLILSIMIVCFLLFNSIKNLNLSLYQS
jgi:hypothetical protein